MLYAKLHQERLLWAALEYYASRLKELHESWERHLETAEPNRDANPRAGGAMRLAMVELEDIMPSDSSLQAAGRPALDELLTRLRHRIRPA